MLLSVLLMMAGEEENPDIKLLMKAKNGDRDAFGELFRKYEKRVFRVARRMCGSDDEAWDITQDAFIRAMQAMDKFDTRYRFFTWIYRITTNLAINYSKKKMRRREVHFEEAYSAEGQQVIEDNLADRAAGEQLARSVSKAVEKLTPALKVVFVLRVDQQLSYSEIAESLDIAMGTVMSRLNRARDKIREELGLMLGEWQ
ncbi:MAG: sigma-70 family RNA polymerase sigma factor [Candidatus Aegiribacteria sp.]|nr:sigma-70 family RNA polymerase sigma factor [Candidatus Aegiribacteria sp.]